MAANSNQEEIVSFSAEDIDFVQECISDIWDNSPNDLENLPRNAIGWRSNGDFVTKTNSQTTVKINLKTKEVEVYANENGLSNRNRTTL